jgi:hypothetical protein
MPKVPWVFTHTLTKLELKKLPLESIVYHKHLVAQFISPALQQLDGFLLDFSNPEQREWLCSVNPRSTTCLLAPVWHEELDIQDWYLQALGQPALVLAHTLHANCLIRTHETYITSAIQNAPPISDSILHANSYNIQGHSKYKQVMLEHKSPTILNPHVFNDIL